MGLPMGWYKEMPEDSVVVASAADPSCELPSTLSTI